MYVFEIALLCWDDFSERQVFNIFISLDRGGVRMRYYKQLDESGKLIAIGTGPGNAEITEAEYNALLAEIREKAAYIEKLYAGEITADDVPEAWREEVQANVDALKAADEEAAQQDISAEEALNIILGGETA